MRPKHVMLFLLALPAGWAIWQSVDGGGAPGGAEDAPQRFAAPPVEEPPRDEIHGRVLRADGSPVAGAQVRLSSTEGMESRADRGLLQFEPHGEPIATVASAADGDFRFAGPLRGNHRLDLTSGAAREYRFGVPAGDFVEFTLGAGNRIEGRLSCADHEQESFSGEMWLMQGSFAGNRLLATPVLPDGSFSFDSLPPRSYRFAAQVDGHFAYKNMGGVQLVGWGETVRTEIRVRSGTMVAGRVESAATREPIPGATVWLAHGEGRAQLTDMDGRFRFQESLPPDGSWRDTVEVIVEAPGFERGVAESDLKSDCVIALAPEHPLALGIRGLLLDSAGLPVPGARITARGEIPPHLLPGEFQRTAETDAHGSFDMSWPGNLDTSLLLETADRRRYLVPLGLVSANDAAREIRLPALRVWNLRLQDGSGKPAADVELKRAFSLHRARAPHEDGQHELQAEYVEDYLTTDSFGRCQFTTDDTGPVKVEVLLNRSPHWTFPLPDGGGEHVLTLENLRRAPCRVLTAERRPAEDFIVVVVDAEHPMPDFGTGVGGVEDFGNLFPAAAGGIVFLEGNFQREVSIVIVGEFMPAFRRHGIALDEGPIEIVLPWTATCAGRVVDAAGRPVPAATLFLIENGAETAFAETDADGNFRAILQKGRIHTLVAVDASGRRSEPVGALTSTSGLVLRIQD